MPRTFLGFLPMLLPSTTPPTSPAAAVATPATRATFGTGPFELELALRAPSPDDRADEPDDRADEPDDRADELRLRDAAADEPRFEPLALLGLLRDAEDLLLLFDERVFAWAIAPP